jgi:outer membrane protein assembly factor BamB
MKADFARVIRRPALPRWRGTGLVPSVLMALCAGTISAGDWPQWRGPGMHGVSSETGLPDKWGPDRNIAWKTDLAGLGASSPIAWGDLIVVTSQVGNAPVRGGGAHPLLARDDRDLSTRENAIGGKRPSLAPGAPKIFLVVEAFARGDGKKLWEQRIEASGELPENHEKHNLATPTPITDGERVYAWFGNGQIVALDMQGRLLWKRHLAQDYGSFLNPWGHGSSPVLHAGRLILLCDHEPNAYLLALDARNGETRWKADRGKDRISHSTPLVVTTPSGPELLINSSQRIDAYDPLNGELLWHADAPRQTPIPSAVFHDGTIYLSRGYRSSDYLAIKPGGRGDVTATHVKWRHPSAASYVPSIIQYQGLLYMTNEIGVVTCADTSTGERVWRHRLQGVFFASPVAADGKVYMLSETGETFVLKAGRTPEVVAVNVLPGRFIASPAISGGRLLLRSDRTLYSIGR